MHTEDLIAMLARGPDVGVTAPARRHTVVPLLGGLLASTGFMGLVLGVRPDIGAAILLPAFWLKIVFTAALGVAGWRASRRFIRPGAATTGLSLWFAVPVLMMWCVAGVMLLQAAPEDRAALFWGSTWRYCPLLITLMSLPLLTATLIIMRRQAPTRLRLAGAAAGLACGGVAASVYCLHCPEMSAVFVGFWYVVGILIPATLGAVLGPRVLAW